MSALDPTTEAEFRAIAERDDLLDAIEDAFNQHAAQEIEAQIQTAFDAAGVVATGDDEAP